MIPDFNESEMAQCAPCAAAWGFVGLECADLHDERHSTLAEALALAFNPPDTEADRLTHIGWFMEDAEDIIAQGVNGPPWKVKVIKLDDPAKFSVNGKFCLAHSGEKDRGFVEVFGVRDRSGE